VVHSRKVSRARIVEVVKELDPTAIAMEACASAHHWGRWFEAEGRQVRLINPRYLIGVLSAPLICFDDLSGPEASGPSCARKRVRRTGSSAFAPSMP
jgi:hypothetical protein